MTQPPELMRKIRDFDYFCKPAQMRGNFIAARHPPSVGEQKERGKLESQVSHLTF
jgi:hypothetical protein